MVKVGLTGGIGSGKTTVSRIFNVLGIPVFDADYEAKTIMETDLELVGRVQETFGEESYTDGILNRPYLAKIVFNNPTKLSVLNSLVHPATIDAANRWMARQTTPYVIKEAALMFESGSASNVDYVIGVYAPHDLRVRRVMQRDNVDSEQVLIRMSRQISEVIKMKLCDFVVVNDDQQLLIPQVLQLHHKLMKIGEEQ
ncbi:dephospho-CoA kinase [Segetibacter aerophilus]|uniref:Dephospho-CoA kinase n=1 Tax=Segetibacter aerophilus TaxID=670293 RepID=A0A512BH70_9BACT|nr:dephospho-CoA kinase [Segetibacter aerophilus]GEO11314.1 dephospho-CoA kinase [Segetibacter aerophilus]